MLDIFAKTFRTATRTDKKWDAPAHFRTQDHRTSAERHRDMEDQRRWLRQTGIL